MSSPAPRWSRRFATAMTLAGLLLVGIPAAYDVTTSQPADAALAPASHRVEHPNRKIKKYRVKPGDTAAGVATRYHAWTAQLIAINHASMFHPGQVIRIPVVVEAMRACRIHRHHHTHFRTGPDHGHQHKKSAKPVKAKPEPASKPVKKPVKKPATKPVKKPKATTPKRTHRHPDQGWVHPHASRAEVRRMILKRAHAHGVNPDLALAIAWQESGWQQKQVSSAGALGVMQVMPGTGQWMSDYVGRKLNLRNLHDNITAGVVLIKVLREQAGPRYAVAGYYQGLGGVRKYGMYDSTKLYLANVLALKNRITRGWNPA